MTFLRCQINFLWPVALNLFLWTADHRELPSLIQTLTQPKQHLSSSLSHNPETATCDDVFTAPSSPSCEVSVSAGTEKRYPTRTNRGPPIYLRDYELK